MILDDYRREADAMDAVIAETTNFDAPTPVKEWTPRDILAHINWFYELIEAKGVGGVTAPQPQDDAAAFWAAQRALGDTVFANDELMNTEVEHRGRPMKLTDIASNFFLVDLFLHRWDIARSQGVDARWPEEQARALAETFAGRVDAMAASGNFGTPVDFGPDTDPTRRLIALIGRDPDWNPAA